MLRKPKARSSKTKLNTTDRLKFLASKKGVTILLDLDGVTDEAKIGTPYSYNPADKILRIVAQPKNSKYYNIILEIIRNVFSSGELIWREDKQETLDSYKKYSEEQSDQKVIDFFENILPRNDFYALKMSLYLRNQSKLGRNIAKYKSDIWERFGERGRNIANLCSAGYFESEFMPLYNQVPKESFHEYYEIAVGKKARALFIHSGMEIPDIEREFDVMLDKALKYHMEDFRIHGMGYQNVKTIKAFVTNKPFLADDRFVIQKGYDKDNPPAVEYIVKIMPE